MNKKAFTMVELLVTIIILGLVSSIAVVTYQTIMTNTSTSYFERFQDTMHAEAIMYVTKNYNSITWSNNKATISLSALQVDRIKNPINSNDYCTGSYVEVTRTHVSNVLSITYKVCLVCPNTTFKSGFNTCKTYEN